MKKHMKSSRPISLVELKGLIANTWSSIQVQELENLAASMPKTVGAVGVYMLVVPALTKLLMIKFAFLVSDFLEPLSNGALK